MERECQAWVSPTIDQDAPSVHLLVVSQFEVRDKRRCRKLRFQGSSRPYPDAPFGSIDGLEWLLQTAFAEHSLSRLDFIFNLR